MKGLTIRPAKAWLKAKHEIKKTWDVLSMDDIEATRGNVRAFCGLIEFRIGLAEEKVRTQLKTILAKYFK